MYSCDIFCLPSITDYYDDGRVREKEGIPVALMEAMKWGKPVVSTNHAGIPELVDNYLVEENNVDELQQTLNFLLDNPDNYSKWGNLNQKKVNEKFTESNINIFINSLSEICD